MNSTKNWIAVATLALITSCAEQGGDPGNTSMPDAGMMGIGGGMGGGAGGGIGGGAAGAGGGGAAACPDLDRDGFQDRICNPNRATGGDCDETNELRHPGRMENCGNMIDDDCDGVVNNGCGSTCADLDGDGFEDARCNVSRQSGADCDDRDINVNPGQMERCGNFKDDDCQGGDVRCLQNCTDNDLDGFGAGSGCLGPDCNDTNPTINPWASEICGDNVDQDCNGADMQCPAAPCTDQDRDGFGVGANCVGNDCNDRDPTVNPGARDIPSDDVDQDCDGRIIVETCANREPACSAMHHALSPTCVDRDQDGYGEGTGCLGTDCDDTDPRVNSGRTEVCSNGKDDDCADDGDRACFSMGGGGQCVDNDGDGFGLGGCPRGNLDCDDNNQAIHPDARELCNGVDDNCNNTVDECLRRGQVCDDGGQCVGLAGAPCRDDTACAVDRGLTCNTARGECRVRDGEPCADNAECNPGAECITLEVCDDTTQRCYQAKGGPCAEDCDCTGDWLCHEDNGRCIECFDDFECDADDRDICTGGGYCTQLVSIGGEGNDARTQFHRRIVDCWRHFAESNEIQGCDTLTTEAVFTSRGGDGAVNTFDPEADYFCDDEGSRDHVRANGFTDDDIEILIELFGCGLFQVRNLWLPSGIRPDTIGDTCIYYVPEKPGFGFPRDVRPAVVVDRCDRSSFED